MYWKKSEKKNNENPIGIYKRITLWKQDLKQGKMALKCFRFVGPLSGEKGLLPHLLPLPPASATHLI